MTTKTVTLVGVVVVALIVAIAAIAAGGGEESEAADTDGAFIAAMIPHHESAIEMAEMAQDRAQHPEIKQLAGEIIDAQEAEIETLEGAHERLYGEPVGEMSHGSLGLEDSMMGMDGNMSMLESAKPFDREFIDMMIAHHQGAIRMARIELEGGQDEETLQIAGDVVDAQSREIDEMNEWRTDWYGSPSPSGGIPDEDETMDGMDMEGM